MELPDSCFISMNAKIKSPLRTFSRKKMKVRSFKNVQFEAEEFLTCRKVLFWSSEAGEQYNKKDIINFKPRTYPGFGH